MNVEFIEALEEIEQEKGISKDVILEALESALISSYKKNFGSSQNVEVEINKHSGIVKVYAQKNVVEDVKDELLEISLEEAKNIDDKYQLGGDIVNIEITPKKFWKNCSTNC